MKIWEPKPPGTLWVTPRLLRDCFTAYTERMFLNNGAKILEVQVVLDIRVNSGSQVSKHTSWRLITRLNNQMCCSSAHDASTLAQEIPRVLQDRMLFTGGQKISPSRYNYIQVIYFHSVSQSSILILCSNSDIALPSFSAQEILGKDISLQFPKFDLPPHSIYRHKPRLTNCGVISWFDSILL